MLAFQRLARDLREGLAGLEVLLWPGPCAACGGDLPARAVACICPECWAGLPVRRGPGCRRCDLPATRWLDPNECPDCAATAGQDDLDHVIAAFEYRDSLVAIHRRLKFGGAVDLAAPLGALMAEAWKARGRLDVDLIVRAPPDPLRWTPRRRTPGLLAHVVARRLGLPCERRALRKVRTTRPLTRRAAGPRRNALAGLFRARAALVAGRTLLVVDDVATTGATAREAARALVEAGAAGVAALVLARTPSGASPGAPRSRPSARSRDVPS